VWFPFPWPQRLLLTRVLKQGLLLLALLATVAVSALTTMRVVLSAREVEVPSVLNRRLPEAGAITARRSLALRIEGKRHDPRVPADRIAAQEPPPGAPLKAHRSVRVWVSLGPQRLTVPNLQGEGVRTARVSLEQSAIALARVVEVPDSAAEGTILVQHPPPGEVEDVGDGVSLLVSRGPGEAAYIMPDLIGRRADSVLDRLKAAGLKVAEVRYRTYPGVAPGIVLRQAPAAGHRVTTRDPLGLDVSKADS
jgi:beta-lactam-binding protein with PASTA domain